MSGVKLVFHIHLHCLNRDSLYLLLINCETGPVVSQQYRALTKVYSCHSPVI
jgi:hypothetical protein